MSVERRPGREMGRKTSPQFESLRKLLHIESSRMTGAAYVEAYRIDNVPSGMLFDQAAEQSETVRVSLKGGHNEGVVKLQITGLKEGPGYTLEVLVNADGSHTEPKYLVSGKPVKWETPPEKKPNVEALISLVIQSSSVSPREGATSHKVGGDKYAAGEFVERHSRSVDFTDMQQEDS